MPRFFVSSIKVWFRSSLLLTLACGLNAWSQEPTQAASAPQRPLITEAIDETQVTRLPGNTHPLARPEFDLGMAPATLPMQRMLLVLKRSPEQEHSLRTLLDNQQDKKAPNYHKWLTPDEYGSQFGPTDADMQTITGWLRAHGFEVGSTKGRTLLEFSGSASQVQEAFHTTIHKYLVNGEQHWANANDPSIPTALVPAVAGVMTLHNFISKPQSHFSKEPVLAKFTPGGKPQVTFPAQNGQPVVNALEPQDYAVIYNIRPAYSSWTGQGMKIGVIGRSDLYNGGQDFDNFMTEVGSGPNIFGGSYLNVIIDGPDPGVSDVGDEFESTLDTTWSGAIAPGATINFVVSGSTNNTDGIDLSELYIAENNIADIMTESYSACEYFATDARLQGISALAEQIAAQGITYFVSAGDDGAEGCDDPNSTVAQYPISVNAFASTAFTVAVGGTMFNENGDPTKYWTSTPPISETAISYIPENVWNESSPTNGLWSGSGGASAGNIGDTLISPVGTTGGVPKPSWQSGVAALNIPADGVRDLPDVSLTAAGHDPYVICWQGSCVPNSQGELYVYFVYGTSASAPSMAAIMALIDQSAGGRQGQANYVFYALASSQAKQGLYPSQCNGSETSGTLNSACIFNDVTVGNNVVPGEVGTDYQAGAGYDLASGLGSVNVANLISNWSTVEFNATSTTLNMSPNPVNITHGQSVNVSATVTPNSPGATPTGDVVLYISTGAPPVTMDQFHLSGGTVSGSTHSLPGEIGSYSVWAHYGGDGTFAPSDSSSTTVTVTPEQSTTALSLIVTDLFGNPLTSPYPFGSLVMVRADIAGKSGYGIPTGQVTFTDTFGPLPSSNPQVSPPVPVVNNPSLNSQGNTSIGDAIVSFDAGNHSISGSYSGDTSFNASSSTSPVTFTIQPGFGLISGPTNVQISAPGGTGTSTVGIIASTGFNTAVTFTCSGLPAETTCSSASASGQGPINVVSTSILVTTTAAHTTMLRSSERQFYYAVLFGGGLPLTGIFLIGRSRRRWFACVGLLMLMALLIGIPACGSGGGGSSSHQDPGTPAGTYSVTVTATAASLSQSGVFSLVVQ